MKMKEFENGGGSESYRRFAKDKRVRIQTAEPVSRNSSPRPSAGGKPAGISVRRSFNPNFTADNKLQEGNERRTKPIGRFSKSGASAQKTQAHSASGKYKGSRPSKFAKKAMGTGESMRGEYPKYPAPKQDGAMRLNRYVAMSGLCSRREADDYIRAGVWSVNGKVVTELGTKVFPADEVKFNDQKISSENESIHSDEQAQRVRHLDRRSACRPACDGHRAQRLFGEGISGRTSGQEQRRSAPHYQ